jgi:3-dehydroquinate dehydratase II
VKKVLLIHGPNLGLLGLRRPDLYGSETQDDLVKRVKDECTQNIEIELVQSNHEGVLIDKLNEVAQAEFLRKGRVAGILINPAALTHTSIAVRDAVEMIVDAGIPIVEVHLTNIAAREDFRNRSLISEIVNSSISGLGPSGYNAAARALNELMQINSKLRTT